MHISDQLANSLTKPLTRPWFLVHRTKLRVLPGPYACGSMIERDLQIVPLGVVIVV